ncbi:hypothetical protein T11_325 [Trichinella zimbabwensis]|uniref:Uncharacterized protein n=1 Tax=Trichinella zimbabwensis TaxID=268475 RepID=A0A0V1F5C9_9BILA|nr:hypothetical protein T11_325 [Trichinella zimbabwensis]
MAAPRTLVPNFDLSLYGNKLIADYVNTVLLQTVTKQPGSKQCRYC